MGGPKKKVPKSEAKADGEPSQRQPKCAKKGKEVEACEKGPAEDKGTAQASQVVKKELQDEPVAKKGKASTCPGPDAPASTKLTGLPYCGRDLVGQLVQQGHAQDS